MTYYSFKIKMNSSVTCSIDEYFDNPISNNYIRVIVNEFTLEDVMNRALTFDFNKYKKEGDQTFESKFMERTANELGNMIKPAAAEIIILQFRKFMAVMSFNLMIERESDINPEFSIDFLELGTKPQTPLITANILNIKMSKFFEGRLLVQKFIIWACSLENPALGGGGSFWQKNFDPYPPHISHI